MLRGYRLSFAGYSLRRESSVATVLPSSGSLVNGRLFSLPPEDWVALDLHEGVGSGAYRRVAVTVECLGTEVAADTYVKSVNEQEGAPALDYVDQIRFGYRDVGLPEDALDASLSSLRRCPVSPGRTRVFVYGTLKRGFSNHGQVGNPLCLGPACTVDGWEIRDLGPCPAMCSGTGVVSGEVYEVDEAALARLDRLESHPDEYCRQAIALEDGTWAEAYVMEVSQLEGTPAIPGGEWTRHRQRARAR